MNFAAAKGSTLGPSLYDNAIREPFHSETGNGLSIFGNGRGCNSLKGFFEIFEIEFTEAVAGDDNGYEAFRVSKLALDFVQHCEGSMRAMRGKIRLNSNFRL